MRDRPPPPEMRWGILEGPFRSGAFGPLWRLWLQLQPPPVPLRPAAAGASGDVAAGGLFTHQGFHVVHHGLQDCGRTQRGCSLCSGREDPSRSPPAGRNTGRAAASAPQPPAVPPWPPSHPPSLTFNDLSHFPLALVPVMFCSEPQEQSCLSQRELPVTKGSR